MILPNLDCEPFFDLASTEVKRILEQTQLDASKSAFERNHLGQFATPNSLAIEILNYSKNILPSDDKIRFLDPAFGTGSFYSALLQSFPVEQIDSAIGYEIDRDYAEVAIKLWERTPLHINISDFTESVPPINDHLKSNLLICNPPYVRHHHLSTDRKKLLKNIAVQSTNIHLSGLAGLYCYFLLAAHQWMSPNGLACWLIPAEFMDVNYGRKIKEYLLDHVTLLRVHRFDSDDLQFSDVLVSSTAIWIRNTKPSGAYSVDFTFGGSIREPKFLKRISSNKLKAISKWNKDFVVEDCTTHNRSKLKLSDLFKIKRGIATGANRFFILTPEKIRQYRIPSELLTPILPSSRYLTHDEVLADEQGNPQIDRPLFLLNCKQSIEELRIHYPSVLTYLQEGIESGISERYLCRHRSLWYLQENRSPTHFLCTYMGRNQSKNSKPFRFILNHSQAIAPNVYLMMYPRKKLASLLEDDSTLICSIWQALNLIPREALINEGRVYGDGLYKLEPKELGNAPADLLLEALNP
jgi:adenine-specific DNA-methyltransferase